LIPFRHISDPFNAPNTIGGFACGRRGVHESSLFITHVKNVPLPKATVVYGAVPTRFPSRYSNASAPPKNKVKGELVDDEASQDDDDDDRDNGEDGEAASTSASPSSLANDGSFFDTLPLNVEAYFLGFKYNGTSILFFKYADADGSKFVTAKPRRAAVVADTAFGDQFTLCAQALSHQIGGGLRVPPSPAAVAAAEAAAGSARASASAAEADLASPSSASSSPAADEATVAAAAAAAAAAEARAAAVRAAASDVAPLPPLLSLLADDKLQSICFELCGSQLPHLIAYDFEIALKPLYKTDTQGNISPVLVEEGGHGQLHAFVDRAELEGRCRQLQAADLAANEACRAKRSLSPLIWLNHFAVEGHVLYLLQSRATLKASAASLRSLAAAKRSSDTAARVASVAAAKAAQSLQNGSGADGAAPEASNPFDLLAALEDNAGSDGEQESDDDNDDDGDDDNGNDNGDDDDDDGDGSDWVCLDRRTSLLKIKPSDCKYHHSEVFDRNVQFHVLETLDQLRQKFGNDSEPAIADLFTELDMRGASLERWKDEITRFVIDLPPAIAKARRRREGPTMLVLVGVPGSGKSYVAEKLAATGHWTRVNQDELRTRSACLRTAESALLRGQHVVIDRCNFDIAQRQPWVKLGWQIASTTIDAIVLDVDPELCKQRIASRESHPTIAPKSDPSPIVDRFAHSLVAPHRVEGFDQVRSFSASIGDSLDTINHRIDLILQPYLALQQLVPITDDEIVE
jgi:predicted kinase